MKRLTKEKSIFSAPSQPKPPMEVTVKKADNGGYIVRYYDESYSSKEAVYDDMDGVMECLKGKLGKKAKE